MYCVFIDKTGGNYFEAFYDMRDLLCKSVSTMSSDFSALLHSIFGIIIFLVVISVFLEGITFIKKFLLEDTEPKEDDESIEEILLNDGMDIAISAIVIGFIGICIFFAYNSTHPSLITTSNTETREIIDPTKMPVVEPITSEKPFIITKDKDYTLTPIAKYRISGIVVAKNTTLDDSVRKIGPIDIGLIFGKLAESENQNILSFRSSERYLYPQFNTNFPLDVACHYWSHNHIIPANNNIFKAANSLENGQAVTFDGYLVIVKFSAGNWGKIEMIPTGVCKPICQVIYVSEVRIRK